MTSIKPLDEDNDFLQLQAAERLNLEIENAHKRGDEEGWIEFDEVVKLLKQELVK